LLETERLVLREPPEGGKYVIERRVDGVVVGRVGIQVLDPVTWRPAPVGQPELGWTLLPEHRGRGYATEAARAVRDAFQGGRLVSLITPANLPSRRVAERLGARRTEAVVVDGQEWVVWLHP
jgi:RimJ/RimL family protein N-acetyltransferase